MERKNLLLVIDTRSLIVFPNVLFFACYSFYNLFFRVFYREFIYSYCLSLLFFLSPLLREKNKYRRCQKPLYVVIFFNCFQFVWHKIPFTRNTHTFKHQHVTWFFFFFIKNFLISDGRSFMYSTSVQVVNCLITKEEINSNIVHLSFATDASNESKTYKHLWE